MSQATQIDKPCESSHNAMLRQLRFQRVGKLPASKSNVISVLYDNPLQHGSATTTHSAARARLYSWQRSTAKLTQHEYGLKTFEYNSKKFLRTSSYATDIYACS